MEVTASDPATARGQLNAALKSIREQSPEIVDSYLLGAEMHERAKLYRMVFEGAALTPPALAKHWKRLPEEAKSLRRGGTNLHADPPVALPTSRHEENRRALEELKRTLWPAAK